MERARATEKSMPQRAVYLAGLALWAAQAMPAQRAGAEEITFDEALALGEETPEVVGSREALQVRESADEAIGGTAGPTTLMFMPGALVAPREDKGFDMQAAITQGWNLGDLGGARREAARQERGALSAGVRAKALRARLEAARRWIDLATLTKIQQTLEQRIDTAQELVSRRERALANGVGTMQAWAEAEALLAELKQRRLDLEGDEFSAATQLALAVGKEPRGQRLSPSGPLPRPPVPDEREIRSRIEDVDTAPEVVLEQLRESAARARAVEASAQYAPVLNLGAQGERGALGSWVVYGVTGVTFHGFGQDQRSVAIAEAEAASIAARTKSARLRARAEVEEALHELKHTAAVAELIEERTLPALRRLVVSRTRAVELGEEYSYALTEARNRELAAIEAMHRAQGANSWARVHMWLLLAELASTEHDQ